MSSTATERRRPRLGRPARAWTTIAILGLAAAGVTGCGTTVPMGQQEAAYDAQGVTNDQAEPGLGTTGTSTTGPTGLTGRNGSTVPDVNGAPPGQTTTDPGVTSTNGTTTSTGPGTSTAPSSTTSSNGTTTGGTTSGPISVGVILTSTSNATIGTKSTYSEQQIDDALFKAIDKQGGIDGRQLDPVYAKTDTGSSNWASDFAAACATFTQDHHVAAVVGYAFDYDQGFEKCLTDAGIPHINDMFGVPDSTELANHPLFRAVSVPTIDERSLLKLKSAISDGYLTKSSSLGVALDNCPGTMSSWERTAKPLLDSAGIKYTLISTTCGTGNNSDASADLAAVPNDLVKLRAAGVNVLTFLGVSEGPDLYLVAEAAEAQGWHPRYLVSSLANLSTLEGSLPADQAKDVVGYGWMPSQDVDPSQLPRYTSSQTHCLALLKTENVTPTQAGDLNNAFRICTSVFAYAGALAATKGNDNGSAVVQAIDGFGTKFSNPDVLDGATTFGGSHVNNAPADMRRIAFSGSCNCFAYTGPVRRFP